MRYLELFAGIGAGSLAMRKTFGKKAQCVGFSEIFKPSIQTYLNHFPTHSNLGNILEIDHKKIPEFDLLIAGFPCKNLTRLSGNHRNNLKGKHSGLFWPMLDIIKKKKPKYFLIENVESMDDIARDEISEMLGVEHIMVPSKLVSAQGRKRYYWANFPTDLPKDKGIRFRDILEDLGDGYKHPVAWSRSTRDVIENGVKVGVYYDDRFRNDGIANTCVTGIGCSAFSSKNVVLNKKPKKELISNSFVDKKDSLLEKHKGSWRYLTVTECERLQTFPDGWTKGMSERNAYKAIGDAFTVDVIAHHLDNLKKHLLKVG